MSHFHVVIDGPAGSGKSTISKSIRRELGLIHIDTGAMYRAITYLALKQEINLANEDAYLFLEDTKIDYHDDKIFLMAKMLLTLLEAIK